MDGFIGTLSDGFPLFGYQKRPYIFFASILGIAALSVLIWLPHKIAIALTILPPILFLFANFQNATVDLLCEGKYSEIMRKSPETGSDIVSFVWFNIMIGKLLAVASFGPLVDNIGTSVIFIICVPLALQILIPTIFGFLPEDRLPKGKRNTPKWDIFKKEKHLFLISSLISTCAIGLIFIGLFSTPQVQFIYVLIVSVVLTVLSILWMPRLMAFCNIYMFVEEMLHPNIGGVLDFWFTANDQCVPGGPHFSYTYYSTWTGLVGVVASLLAVVLFQKYISKWTFRKAFWITTAVRIVASIFDLLIIMRWNIYVGIPDKVVYMLGDAIILDIVAMLNFMPGVVLISRLCPDKMESTVYAILAGFSNFGLTMARSLGNFATVVGGISTVEPCNFKSLPWMVFLCHFLFPLLTIPLTFLLIPDVHMTERLLEKSKITENTLGEFDMTSTRSDSAEHSDPIGHASDEELEMPRLFEKEIDLGQNFSV